MKSTKKTNFLKGTLISKTRHEYSVIVRKDYYTVRTLLCRGQQQREYYNQGKIYSDVGDDKYVFVPSAIETVIVLFSIQR